MHCLDMSTGVCVCVHVQANKHACDMIIHGVYMSCMFACTIYTVLVGYASYR